MKNALNILRKFFTATYLLGVDKDKSYHFKKQLVMINRVSFLLIVFGFIAFIVSFLIHNIVSELRYISLMLVGMLCLYFNSKRLFLISKAVLVLCPAVIMFITPILFHNVPPSSLLWYPYAAATLGIIPILIFDLNNEKIAFVFSSLLYLFFVCFSDVLFVKYIPISVNYTIISDNYLIYKISHIVMWCFVFSIMYFQRMSSIGHIMKLEKTNEAILRYTKLTQNQSEEIIQKNTILEDQKEEILSQQERIEQQLQIIQKRNTKLEKFNKTLIQLSKSAALQSGNYIEALQDITKHCSLAMDVARVSIWELDAEKKGIKCLCLYKQSDDSYSSGTILREESFPSYFSALRQDRSIIATDAVHHHDTYEFAESYLKPLGIYSMLDNPYFIEGKLAGVVCCEHENNIREWLSEETAFTLSIADLVSIAYKTSERKKANAKIEAQQKEILKINKELESKIMKRTEELERQNHKLAEYAFINSHLLRGPLCRILGLSNLLLIMENPDSKMDVLGKLDLSAKELEAVVKSINKTLEETELLSNKDTDIIREQSHHNDFMDLLQKSKSSLLQN
ncbi:MAG: GAF domain-containing protein [Cytophagales bacterium]|nr:GAF domain-containing protein [Cytophagales bacterium]